MLAHCGPHAVLTRRPTWLRTDWALRRWPPGREMPLQACMPTASACPHGLGLAPVELRCWHSPPKVSGGFLSSSLFVGRSNKRKQTCREESGMWPALDCDMQHASCCAAFRRGRAAGYSIACCISRQGGKGTHHYVLCPGIRVWGRDALGALEHCISCAPLRAIVSSLDAADSALSMAQLYTELVPPAACGDAVRRRNMVCSQTPRTRAQRCPSSRHCSATARGAAVGHISRSL